MKQLLTLCALLSLLFSCQQQTQQEHSAENKPVDSLALKLGIDAQLLEDKRLIPLEGADNFRDIGGLKTQNGKSVKWGKLYRSGKLSGLTAADFTSLEDLAVKTVVDFRTNSEFKLEADTLPPFVSYLHLPIGEDSWSGGALLQNIRNMTPDSMENFMVELYAEIPIKWSDQYKRYFESLQEPASAPLVYHCTSGKDRTGIATAMLLYSLGVDMATIKKEYELTNYYRYSANQKTYKALEKYGIPTEISKPLMGVKGTYLDRVFAEIGARYGSMDAYMAEELGLDEAAKKKLQALYLE